MSASKGPKKRGPRSTLVDDPRVQSIKKRLAEKGFTSFSEAAASVGMSLASLTRGIRHGLSADPKAKTLEKYEDLGILDLVRGASDVA